MELINVTVYEPHQSLFKCGRNDKAEVRKFYCSKKSECDYLKENTCLNVGAMGRPCPYGSCRSTEGFTKKARAYHDWIRKQKEENKDFLWKISSAPKRIAKIGEEWSLPYAFMNMNKSVGFMSEGQPILTELNTEVIFKLINFKPQAMFGGEITDYQKKHVPKFLKDLQVYYPELFANLTAAHPEIITRIAEYSYVGRYALVSTLKEGCKISASGGTWEWDGEYLISTNYKTSFFDVGYTEIYMKIKPKEGEKIKITSDDQVSDSTTFLD